MFAGKGIGSIVTGSLFDEKSGLGPVWTFRAYGFFALALLILYTVLHFLVFRHLTAPAKSKQALENRNGTGKKGSREYIFHAPGQMIQGCIILGLSNRLQTLTLPILLVTFGVHIPWVRCFQMMSVLTTL